MLVTWLHCASLAIGTIRQAHDAFRQCRDMARRGGAAHAQQCPQPDLISHAGICMHSKDCLGVSMACYGSPGSQSDILVTGG